MASREPLTSERWKGLLDPVREELGEGKVRGFGLNRYLEIPSRSGLAELRLGSGYDEHEIALVYLILHATKAARTDLRIGSTPRWRTGWQRLKTGDEAFDAAAETWAKTSGKPGGMPSKSARSAFLELVDQHPKVHLFVEGRDITVVRPGTHLERPQLTAFVLKAVACVDKLLGG
jgi:hypothetical protein